MKKTLGAILAVLAVVIAVGTFGARYTSDRAEAIVLQPTPDALSFAAAAGGGAVSATDPLLAITIPAAEADATETQELNGKVRAVSLNLSGLTDPRTGGATLEQMRLMSHAVSPAGFVNVEQDILWAAGSNVIIGAKGTVGTGTVTLTINGYACINQSGTLIDHGTPNVGVDPNVSPPTGCPAGYTNTITTVNPVINVWVGYGPAPSAHHIEAINVEETSGDIETIAPGGGVNAITRFDASVAPGFTGEFPLIAKLSTGALADASGNPTEPDRPLVDTDFKHRDFSYSLAGAPDSDPAQQRLNAQVAGMLDVQTSFTRVGGTGDWTAYRPQAIISAPADSPPPEGTHTLVLTGRDNAPSGNSDTVLIRLEVAGLALTAQETTGSPPRPFTKVTAGAPLIALTVPGYTAANYEVQNRHRSAGFELRSGITKRVADVRDSMGFVTSNTEESRIVPGSFSIADETIAREPSYSVTNIRNRDDDFIAIEGLRPGRTSFSYRIRGFICAHDTTPNTFVAPTDNTAAVPSTCPASHSMSISGPTTVTVPVHVGWADAPAAHEIGAVNIEEGSGDLESIAGGTARFDASINSSHSGEVPLIAKLASGALADPGVTSTEPDRPYVYANFQGRDFRYSIAGAPDDDAAQARLNAQVAALTRVETNFKVVGSGTVYQPEAVISIAGGGGDLLPEGTHTLVLTGEDRATGGSSDTALVRIEVAGTRFLARDPATGTDTKVTAANPLIAYTVREGGYGFVPNYHADRRYATREFNPGDGIVKVDPASVPRIVDWATTFVEVADESVAVALSSGFGFEGEEVFIMAARDAGSTTASFRVMEYVCQHDDTDAYVTPPNAASERVPTACPADHTMRIFGPHSVTIPVWVGWADVPAQHVINAAPNRGVSGGINAIPDRFVSTVQSSHTGELPLFAVDAAGELIDTFLDDEPDVPIARRTADRVQVDFQGRLFTYKLTGARDSDSPSQESRNALLARRLVVETVFADTPGSPVVFEPVARISAREGAALPVGVFTLTLTGSDDTPGGRAATVAVVVTVTGANRAPVATVDGDPDSEEKTEHPLSLRERAAAMGADGEPVVLATFSEYFYELDNQKLTYSAVFRRGDSASPALFAVDPDTGELTLRMALPSYENAPYIDLSVDADSAADDEPKGYKFSIEASDGSAVDSVEVTVTVSARDGVDPDEVAEGTIFDLDENADACAIVGLVEILDADGDPEPGGANGYVLVGMTYDNEFHLNTPALTSADDCGGDDAPAASRNQLRALTAFNHEEEDGYQLTVATDGTKTAPTGTFVTVNVAITDVNEPPMLGVSPTVPDASGTPVARQFLPTIDASDATDDASTEDVDESTHAGNPNVIPTPQYAANVSESANMGASVNVWEPRERSSGAIDTEADGRIRFPDPENRIGVRAFDEDAGDNAGLRYSLMAANSAGAITTSAFSGPFSINASTGAISVSGALDRETTDEYVMYIVASDNNATPLTDSAKLTINIVDANELPFFVRDDLDGMTAAQRTAYCQRPESEIKLEALPPITIDENPAAGMALADYDACDADGDDLDFVIRSETDSTLFALDTETGELTVTAVASEAAKFDYESKTSYSVEVEVVDGTSGQGQVRQTVNLNNVNDNAPVWQVNPTGAPNSLSVNENTLRGVALATYVATDADGDAITYTLSGGDAAQYQLDSASGVLATLASLDADRGNLSDAVIVTADDSGSTLSGSSGSATVSVSIAINNLDDSISSIRVRQANPVLGTHGDPNTALADRKTTLRAAVPEAPTDLPATAGDAVTKFVSAGNARWGSVLRLEVLAQSPDASCGNGNQCVFIDLEGDDSDDTLKLTAFRASDQDNKFIAAVMPVKESADATPGDGGVYKHTDGSVARLEVEEEDTLRIKFGNLRDSVVIDNEAPEFTNFLPEHEASLDDDEVEYTFTITDAISGIPEPEDLPDGDGDDNYMSVVGLVSNGQCANVPADYTPARGETDLRRGKSMVANTNLFEGETLWCAGNAEIRRVQDDKDFDDVDNGYDVETTVVLAQNRISYVTFIACDAAGNCVAFDPDENDRAEAFAEITIDTENPTILMARTGVAWDSSDNTYDDDRNFIQVIFNDISDLNPDTIEQDDFVVEGHTVTRVYWYDDPDAGEAGWDNAAGTDTRFDRGSAVYRAIAKTVFLELEEDLLPDATPDVSVVPNGIEDAAGNEQDDDEREADDWIAPAFTVQSITSPRETSRDNVLVGEDEKVTLTVTSDERISATKPLVDVNYVNAPAGCVDRDGVITRAGRNNAARDDCAASPRGASLNSVITKDGTNEWTIVVDKPSATGYYNVYIYGDDRSSQSNRGSEGVAPDKIGADFFEKDGDVNSDDAVYFEGDVQLPKPRVVVSGVHAGDTEPEVEQKRPLFIEIDFTSTFSADCDPGDNLSDELNCSAETSEYAEDGFDAVTITKFELDGVDMTDSVKTTDDETFLVALNDVSVGDHEITIQAMDVAGNELKDELDVEFSVDERDPFTRRLNPGWNLVSLPGEPADGDISAIFTADIEVRRVYTFNPSIPGGWQVALRETLDGEWRGDLTRITEKNGYWVLSDAIQDLEVDIPRAAGGALGSSTPKQPPVIPLYKGWNLIPVVDVTGDALDTDMSIDAETYLNSLDDGLDLARVLGFNTITNEWFTVLDPDATARQSLRIGSGYWVFVRESASLVPGGTPR